MRRTDYTSADALRPHHSCNTNWPVERTALASHPLGPCTVANCAGHLCTRSGAGYFALHRVLPGAQRLPETITDVFAYVATISHGDVARLRATTAALRAARVAHVLTSAHTHRPEAPRVLLAFPLSVPVHGSRWGEFFDLVENRFSVGADAACRSPAHVFARPSMPIGARAHVEIGQGLPFPVEASFTTPAPLVQPALGSRFAP